MRVMQIVDDVIAKSQSNLLKRQQASLRAGIEALLRGGRLTLTALGRSLRSTARIKHQIRRIDRLLGNPRMHAQRVALYRAISQTVVGTTRRPVILIDWSGLTEDGRMHLLRASVPQRGRSLTLYEEVHPITKLGNRRVHFLFLQTLKTLLPPKCRPVIVTDGGFRCPWLQMVRRMEWDWVGRLRKRTMVNLDGHKTTWISSEQIYARATTQPQCLGEATLAASNPTPCRLVIVREPKKGRVAKNRKGSPSRTIRSQVNATRAREPWLLTTSLCHISPRQIVAIYKRRMVIEESFRDLKSPHLGWGVERAKSHCTQRLQMLLLIGAFALLAIWLVGLCARARQIHLHLQANTIRDRYVFSLFSLGSLVLRLGLSNFPKRQLLRQLHAIKLAIPTAESS